MHKWYANHSHLSAKINKIDWPIYNFVHSWTNILIGPRLKNSGKSWTQAAYLPIQDYATQWESSWSSCSSRAGLQHQQHVKQQNKVATDEIKYKTTIRGKPQNEMDRLSYIMHECFLQRDILLTTREPWTSAVLTCHQHCKLDWSTSWIRSDRNQCTHFAAL